ncbi:hypothetical protein A0H81_00632 [Grifola frondosa]|uniref:DUF6593 domain-containing protein n=1 Tax=Grifola frondosa TaxID=5627 RepID=A0A1C7MRV8_GRIFR|nr:hypothetical protein A0H81_00632 [Grifola frondosa]
MELTLSKKSPANTVLSDFRGQPQYRISTPFVFFGRTTAIHRVTGHQAGRPRCHRKKSYSGEEELAKIRWSYYCRRTKLQYNGWNLDFHTFMPSQKGVFRHTRRRMVGPDGRTYEWHMKKSCYLDTKGWSGATIPIARLHPSSFWRLHRDKTTFISRIAGRRHQWTDDDSRSQSLETRKQNVAEIHWPAFGRLTRLKYKGQNVEFHSFLPSQGGGATLAQTPSHIIGVWDRDRPILTYRRYQDP